MLDKTKIVWAIILTVLSIHGNCQSKSLVETFTKLNGFWILESYEIDSLQIFQVEEDSSIVFKTFLDSNLITTSVSDGWNVIEIQFDSFGRGHYREYYDFSFTSDFITIYSCQPIPELNKKDNGNVFIQMTGMGGKYTEQIELLTDRKLILFNEKRGRKTYRKIK